MKLSVDQIREITTGAVRVTEEEGQVAFFRFTEEESEFYENRSKEFYIKSKATSGMRFSFKTDSKNLFISAEIKYASTRTYFSFDVFVNGECIGYLDNITGVDIPPLYSTIKLPLGDCSKNFELGEGEKEVTVYLPWSTETLINEISLDDGSCIEPIKRQKKALVYGDSITQGYDALRPSNRYASKLCDALSLEEINKAIGGEIFCAPLAALASEEEPDYVIIAYGTNDWNRTTYEKFKVQCRGFFENIRAKYKNAKIFALTPIWRKDGNGEREFGEFKKATDYIYEAAEGLDIKVVYGYNLVPEDEMLFGDLRLHPNDEGFDHYFKNLKEQIK